MSECVNIKAAVKAIQNRFPKTMARLAASEAVDDERANKMAAIRCAAEDGLFLGSTLADGLRAVMLFEKINGRLPDMTSSYHRSVIHNTGYRFALNRRLGAIKRRSTHQ